MINNNIEEIIENCIKLIKDGKSVKECLKLYPENKDELGPVLKRIVSLFKLSSIKISSDIKDKNESLFLNSVRKERLKYIFRNTTIIISLLAILFLAFNFYINVHKPIIKKDIDIAKKHIYPEIDLKNKLKTEFEHKKDFEYKKEKESIFIYNILNEEEKFIKKVKEYEPKEVSYTELIKTVPDCLINTPELLCYGSKNNTAYTNPGYSSYKWEIYGGVIKAGINSNEILFDVNKNVADIKLRVRVVDKNGFKNSNEKIINVSGYQDCKIAGKKVICEGEITKLCANTVENANYFWTGPNKFRSNDKCVYVSDAGYYRLTITGKNGCISDCRAKVSIRPKPIVKVSDVVIYKSNRTITEAKLTANIQPGTCYDSPTYLWNTGERTKSITVSPEVSTKYNVKVICSGCEGIGEGKVNVVPVPPECNITADPGLEISEGETTTLSVNEIANANYSWTGPNDFTSTDRSITVGDAGTYEVTITDENELSSNCSVELVVNACECSDWEKLIGPVVALDDIEIEPQSYGILEAKVNKKCEVVSYKWYIGMSSESRSLIEDAITSNYETDLPGYYSVNVECKNGCIFEDFAKVHLNN